MSQEVASGTQDEQEQQGEQPALMDAPAEPAPAVAPAESAQVLYRKWRPQSFAEVVGQEPVTRTLRNSVASGRLAHAYLLTGPRGTGKTSLGRLIAKAANCESPVEGEPCNECESCRAFLEGRAMDFIEQDAASHNSVEDIRQLRENVALNPMAARYKVYLLDEVHMLSKGAENALLKTLEEPPRHVIFVLATTEPQRVESTIISRCQRFDLRRIPAPAMVELMARICEKEGFALDEASLAEVARGAGGSLRDAINGLEQIVTYYGASPDLEQVREALGISVDARSAELARLALRGELTEGLKLVAAVRDDGVAMNRFSKEVVGYLRSLLLVKSGAGDTLDETKEMIAEMEPLAKEAEGERIVRTLKTLGKVDFRDDPQSSLPLELALVELASEEPATAAAQPLAAAPVAAGRAGAPVAAGRAGAKGAPANAGPSTLRPGSGQAGSGRAERQARPSPSTLRPGSGQASSGRTEEGTEAAGQAETARPSTSSGRTETEEPANAGPSTSSGRAERQARPSPSTSSGRTEEGAEAAGAEPPAAEAAVAGVPSGLLAKVREACKESDKQLAALLNQSCEVTALEGETLTLGFYHTFHLERVEAGGYADRLGELLSQALGRTVRVELAHAPRRREPGKVKSGHLVEAARELGAKPIGQEGEG